MRKAKQITLGVLSACMIAGMPVLAQEPDTEQVSEASAMQLLEDVRGTYDELFTVTNAPEYDQVWIDACVPFVGEEMAEATADMLKSACTGTIYGQEAIDVYGDGSNGAQFDCFFINGVSQLVFDGTTISGLDENGEEVFSHDYSFAGDLSIAGMMDGFLYETDDEDAGDFRYFLMMPDTPATTYHIEFRYGSDRDALTQYNEGPLAYWLAAGILADRDDQMVTDVIDLFCSENLAEMEQEAAEEAVTEAVTEASVLPEAEEVIEIIRPEGSGKEIGQQVRDARKAAGMKIKDVAELAGVAPGTMAAMECGHISAARAKEIIQLIQNAPKAARSFQLAQSKEAGSRIRDARKAAGLSQKELGVILRVPESAVSRMELGDVTKERAEEIIRRIHGAPRHSGTTRRVKQTAQVLLGRKIRDARENAGLSQKAFGDLVGLPQSRISLIEKGNVDSSTAAEILRALEDAITEKEAVGEA